MSRRFKAYSHSRRRVRSCPARSGLSHDARRSAVRRVPHLYLGNVPRYHRSSISCVCERSTSSPRRHAQRKLPAPDVVQTTSNIPSSIEVTSYTTSVCGAHIRRAIPHVGESCDVCNAGVRDELLAQYIEPPRLRWSCTGVAQELQHLCVAARRKPISPTATVSQRTCRSPSACRRGKRTPCICSARKRLFKLREGRGHAAAI